MGGREHLSPVCSFFVHRSLKNLLHNTHYFFTITPYTKIIANNKCLQDFFHNTELIISALLPFSNIKMPLTAGEAFCFVIECNRLRAHRASSFLSFHSYFFHHHFIIPIFPLSFFRSTLTPLFCRAFSFSPQPVFSLLSKGSKARSGSAPPSSR